MAFIAPKTQTKENDYERYFRWYCEDLIENGFLKRFDRELESFIISPKINYKREKHFKTKATETEDFALFQETTYTYDFRLIWTEKAKFIFTEVMEFDGAFVLGAPVFISHLIDINGTIEMVSYVDVKPHYAAVAYGGGKMKSYYTFPFVQKHLYIMKGLYVNKIIPVHTGKHGQSTCLFATTFVPNRYLYQDKAQGLRKIPYKKRSLVSFVEQKKRINESVFKLRSFDNEQIKLL